MQNSNRTLANISSMQSLNLSDSQMARQILMMFTADKKQTVAERRRSLFGTFLFSPLATVNFLFILMAR